MGARFPCRNEILIAFTSDKPAQRTAAKSVNSSRGPFKKSLPVSTIMTNRSEALCSENTPETLACAISNLDYFVVAVLASGRIVGVGSLHRSGEIRQCYVAPEVLRKQIGSRILKALEERALDWGFSELHLNSSLGARRFYVANGFTLAGESFLWKDVVEVYPMRKQLRQRGGALSDATYAVCEKAENEPRS